jgi:hypothetical protein
MSPINKGIYRDGDHGRSGKNGVGGMLALLLLKKLYRLQLTFSNTPPAKSSMPNNSYRPVMQSLGVSYFFYIIFQNIILYYHLPQISQIHFGPDLKNNLASIFPVLPF